ncbi:LysR substrate-binding domain-containing protein [Parendozoicomonas sp. Alg238-R29]|uniref:LysR substrate-binding domain-containing protein n=1 Tax=Parendozoicomonas sp. Alg238-R29 TaxID=2993446 RepID=UPI00248D8B8B|nr:LysR substrate-binding domain-containing protein [Parendozoicomonas sp. Alg238-R29]
MIQTETLQIVQAVAHFGNFTTAAKHLHKVPSAISYTIRKVEDELGVSLFLRDSRRVELTPAGEHFVKQGEKILSDLSELANSTCQIATGVEPELHIVLDNIINQGPVQLLMEEFRQKFPDTTLHITNEVYMGCWDALFHNRCQLAIGAPVTIPDEISANNKFGWQTMGPLDWKLVMAPDHPLASSSDQPVTLKELNHHTTIVVEDSARVLHHGGDSLASHGQVLVMPNFRQALYSAVKGTGVTMVPIHFAEHLLRDGKLITRPIPALEYNRKCLMAWNKDNMGAALSWCLKWLGKEQDLTQLWLSCREGMAAIDIS